MNTTIKGEIACRKLDTKLLELGLVPSIPVVDVRYDRVVWRNGQAYRVQVKYADRAPATCDGSVSVSLSTKAKGEVLNHHYTEDEVDALVLYIPAVDAICWFEAKDFCGRPSMVVRYEPAKNGQTKGVRWYKDYEL